MNTPRWLGRDFLAVLMLLVLAGAPRLLQLEADHPVEVSPAPITADEGWWAQNARQHALFGRWTMDDHNPALYVAPVYTVALRAVYAVAGVGIWQTRLLSAVAGILTCVALFLGLRALLPLGRALPPAVMLSLSLFPVLFNRAALTESLQLLLVTVAMAGVLWSQRYRVAAVAGGVSLVLAVLCKPNVVIFVPILAGFWAGELWRNRGADPHGRATVRAVVTFSLAGLLAAGLALALFVWPNWADIRQQLQVSLANVYTAHQRLRDGGVEFFYLPFLGLRATAFSNSSLVPLAGLLLLAWRRLTRSGVTTSDPAERLMWWWIGVGLLWQALQSYQPDRRFLVLTVPLVVLGWRGLAEEGARIVSGLPRSGLPRHLLGGLVGGMGAGLVALGYLVAPLNALLTDLRPGHDPSLSAAALHQLLWHSVVAAGVVCGAALWRWAPRRQFAIRAWIWLPLWLWLEPAALLRHLRRPTYSTLEAARTLTTISGHLPADRRVVTGDVANTLALESDLFAFVIRNDSGSGARMNLDGWERFRPGLLISSSRRGRLYGYPRSEDLHGFVPLCTFSMRKSPDGSPLIGVTIWLAPELSAPVPCPPGSRAGS